MDVGGWQVVRVLGISSPLLCMGLRNTSECVITFYYLGWSTALISQMMVSSNFANFIITQIYH